MLNNEVLLFRVNGIPKWKGRARVSTSAKTRRYEQVVAEAAKLEVMKQNWKKSDAPIVLNLCVWFPVPESWPKWKKEMARAGDLYPMVKPDFNIGKIFADALNDIVYNDDRQIVDYHIHNRYCSINAEPYVVVLVEPMNFEVIE